MNKPRLKLAIKLLVSGGLLAYLILQADRERIWMAMRDTDWSLVGVVFLLFFLHFYIGTLRWRLIARLHDADPPIAYLFRSYMVANFFNNFLPSTIGGDMVRIYDTWRAGTSKAAAAATIFVERVLGVMALAILAAIGILMLGSRNAISSELQVLVGLMISGLAGVIFLLFHPPRWWNTFIVSVTRNRISGISRAATRFQSVSGEFSGARRTLLLTLLLSFLLQSNVIFEYYLIGLAIGLDIPPAAYVAIVPIALVTIMLPISINGIGLREGVFTVLFGLFGVTVASALVFSWIFYGLFVAHGVLGGLVYMLRKDRLPTAEAGEGL